MKNLFFTFVLLLTASIAFAQTTASTQADEIAIKQLLEKESKSALAKDYKTWISCFAQSPDVTFGFHTDLPSYMLRGYDKLAAFGKNYFPEHPKPSKTTSAFTDFQIRVNGNTAFATWVQVDTEPDGKKSWYHKADYLEKINGEWKMVGHLFGIEPAPVSEAKK